MLSGFDSSLSASLKAFLFVSLSSSALSEGGLSFAIFGEDTFLSAFENSVKSTSKPTGSMLLPCLWCDGFDNEFIWDGLFIPFSILENPSPWRSFCVR